MSRIKRLMEEKNDLAREVVQLREDIRKCRAWLTYPDWKDYNYTYDEYENKYYKGGRTNGVVPFSPQYEEMDLRKEFIKLNNL